MVEKWDANFKGISHTDRIGIAQKRIHHVRLQFEAGNGIERIEAFRLPRSFLYALSPGRRLIFIFHMILKIGGKQAMDTRRREQEAREIVGMEIGRASCRERV